MSSDPAVYLLCRLAALEIESDRLTLCFRVWANCRRKEHEDGCSLKHQLLTISNSFTDGVLKEAHLLKYVLPIAEVECAE
jgi:hypothetical protein